LIDPIRIEFDVACDPDHAFSTWATRIDTWWPRSHSVTAEKDLEVVLEGRVGGRIFERTASGAEHDWGEVTIWEPPVRLGYLWHLRRDRADATDVEVRFIAAGDGITRVEIEHSGWERLGAEGESWRDRNRGGWGSLLPHFQEAIQAGPRRT
jgi:Activator of Hsp90 ATPase homolog 1-like protein